MASFLCASLSPVQLDPALALATVRAGGIALLDCELCPAEDFSKASKNLRRLLRLVPAEKGRGVIGIRLAASQIITHDSLLESLAKQPHHLVLCGWRGHQLSELLEKLKCAGRQIWLEVRAGDEVAQDCASLSFFGWVARGSECGGRSGRESAFILCQRLARQERPFLVQGGIGPHSATACRVAGAAGVILDDALLLLGESPLSAGSRALVERLSVEDTTSVGGVFGNPYRIVDRADFPAARYLKQRAEEIAESVPEDQRAAAWESSLHALIGLGDPEKLAWPLGQIAGLASALAQGYPTMGKLVRAIIEGSARQIQTAARQQPLAPDGPLARSHRTRYAIVQGPMTRVSDSVPFASAVAENGALPLFALALMRGPQVERLLQEAKQTLGDRSWGVGILGFVPPELRQEQLAIVEQVRPPFALIAGGRPDQALHLESCSIPTYIHVPTPQLLRLFLDQGARRFVFEGGECGGHVGPLSSFALWESMIEVLLTELPVAEREQAHVLFAGGIHDARSAAMVAAMASPLADRGVKIGVLMGTAYLFTEEAVESGAIVEPFQTEALRCRQTVTIETRPGHKIRCAPTPLTTSFERKRAELRREGRLSSETGDELEKLLVGRLRIASKGLDREDDELHSLDSEQQHERGMYMMGELAALRSSLVSCAELHQDVSVGSARLLAAASEAVSQTTESSLEHRRGRDSSDRIAIVGIGCLLPGARDGETLWRNLLDQVDTIREIPRNRWDWRLYYDPDPAARDKIYSRWGAFLDPVPFDPLHFGIPPKSLPSISLPQLLALEVTRRALQDAGFGDSIEDERLRERTAVFFGAANSGDLEQLYKARSALPLCVGGLTEETWQRLPEWTEESYPGILVNIIAGRVSNRFDLGGPNFTLDAACACSLAALDMAVRELQSFGSDLVLAGGIELEQSPQAYMAFSKTRALSPRGRARVFDEEADGIVLSEGAVVLVLKRLADAERAGDRIYAVVRGVAGSSDGKGMGLTAPKPKGQLRAIKRAHEQAGTDLSTLGLYEAHATGTAVGDRAELETITSALREAGARPRACAAGSAKSLLGHTRAAAGMVGLVKAAMALYHRVLPPHAGARNPIESLGSPACQVYLLNEARPWLADANHPRRAGVSAFGFGGTNFHAVLEEYNQDAAVSSSLGADAWPCELFVLAGSDRDSLIAELDALDRAAACVAGETIHLRDLAFTAAASLGNGAMRVALIAANTDELRQSLAATKEKLARGEQLESGGAPPNVFWGFGASPGDLAFLFPGQGAQHATMGCELALYFGEVRQAFELTDALLTSLSEPLSRFILPPAALTEQERAAQALTLADTRIAQPAIATLSCGLLDLARRLGLEAARTAGHSFGEYVALHAADVLGRKELMRLAETRGRILAELGADSGSMATVAMTRAELEPYLSDYPGVQIANHNAPRQLALSGHSGQLDEVLMCLRADGHSPMRLAVSAAFHSALMRPAREPFDAFLASGITLSAPRIPVHANLDGAPYPADGEAIRRRWVEHLEQPVDFVAQIERMYEAGVRTFLELGPGRVATGLVKQILGERPHVAISVDGGLRAWLSAVARLYTSGHQVKVEALFDERPARFIDVNQLTVKTARSTGWLIDGGRVWRADDPTVHAGELPFLDYDGVSAIARLPQTGLAHAPAQPVAGQAQVLADAYREYQETMRHFLDQQERMLTHILAQTGVAQTGAPVAAEPRAPQPIASVEDHINTETAAPRQVEAVIDRLHLTRELIAMVSERTGYHADMLDPEQDLEAELGIDSIKRIEILSRLEKVLPPSFADRVRAQLDRLTRAKSLKSLVEMLMDEISAARLDTRSVRVEIGSSVSSATLSSARLPESPIEDCPRFLMHGAEKSLLRSAQKPLEGLYLVTEDLQGVADLVLAALREHGAQASLIRRDDLLSVAATEERVLVLREVYGPIRGLLHLAPLGLGVASADLTGWRQATALATKIFFRLIQLCADELDNKTDPLRILAVSQLGGDWGRGGVICGSPASGGSYGILQSLEREYPHLLTKVADFDDTLSPQAMAERIVDEILVAGGGAEIGYLHGRRTVFSARRAPLTITDEPRDWRPRKDWVVLVTGGSRGITAEICRELAGPGVRLIVVGRAPEPASDIESDEPDIADLRRRVFAEMNERGTAPTPDEIESETRKRQSEAERRRNLEALRQSGAEVEYHSIDVRSEEAFGGLIENIYHRFGRIDAVVHGAGIIEDRRFREKGYGSFERVFDTKVDSTFILNRRLRPDGLKWIALFSSVSGRFGNQGQSDYAAANETVNRLAWQMDAGWPATRVVSINWGPWSGAGMATGGARRLLEAQGIIPIEPAAGRRFFVDELTYGRKGEVEVIAGRGPWEAETDQLLSSVFEASFLLLHVRELTELIGGIE
jgi:acyl transferase domain-containing protein/NAD(P)H-dependent flavin oxidoreductase YrpB (nitropropane dioxygenase family)/NAD(P)-dependent dehydrogenase (short-subunit alcohol dehydrogenase family)